MKTTTSATDYKPDNPSVGDIFVWHIPQIPMKAFLVKVDSWEEAIAVQDLLAYYDLFQLENRVKGDYFNASGCKMYGGQKYIDDIRDGQDPSTFCDEDSFCEIEDELHYKEQLEYLGVTQ